MGDDRGSRTPAFGITIQPRKDALQRVKDAPERPKRDTATPEPRPAERSAGAPKDRGSPAVRARASIAPRTGENAPKPLASVWIPAGQDDRGDTALVPIAPPAERSGRSSVPPAPQPPNIIRNRPAPDPRALPENAYGIIDRSLETDPPRPPGTAYQLALDFTAAIHTIIELADTERYFVKDALDKKAVQIATGMAQAANDPTMSGRRAQYKSMQFAVVECGALLDIVARRGTVEAELLEPARKLASELIEKLEVLSTPAQRVW
jgi:hypothetical protein